MTPGVTRRTLTAAASAMLAIGAWRTSTFAQSPPVSPSHVVIPFLANATRPADLDFEGAECERDASGDRMTCVFQQVFLTTSPFAPDTCLVTTNRYERTFRRETPNRWVSTEGPEGPCGLLDIVTLQYDGTVRWTMETRRVLTGKASPACLATDVDPPETLSWQNLRRKLPCGFAQPGGLSR